MEREYSHNSEQMPMFPEGESNLGWDFDVFIDRMDSPVTELKFE